MFSTVKVNCSRCGDLSVPVGNSEAIPGVAASYASKAEEIHANSLDHIMKGFSENNPRLKKGLEPIRSVVKANLQDFTHGKDHNA